MPNHIFSAQAVSKLIVRNKNEKNLYEKVNQILKGSRWGTYDLAAEVKEIIERQCKNKIDELTLTVVSLTPSVEACEVD